MFGSDDPLVIQARVVGAIVLRDLRTRFGRTFIGSIIVVAWPLTHLAILMVVNLIVRKVVPAIGTDPAVFVGTGVLPYILCIYPGRQIMLSVMQNKTLLGLPPVMTLDIILARSIVEVIAAFWVTCLFSLFLYLVGVEVIPHRIEDAILAILATVYLALAIGWVGAVMYAAMRAWLAIQIGLLIGMYVTSGIFVIPTSLPEQVRNILWYNPLLHSVEWLRSAYYDGYGYGMLSRTYLLVSATLILLLGLLLERGIRGRLLER